MEVYKDFVTRYENELANPSNPGMFATASSIAENERNNRANLESFKLKIAQEEGKQNAIDAMLIERGETDIEEHNNRSLAIYHL